CCHTEAVSANPFQILCSSLLVLFIIIALSMKFFDRFKKQKAEAGTVVYAVEGMHCNHCKAAVEKSVGNLKGVTSCEATPAANTLVVTGNASSDEVRKAVEKAGFEFKGVKG
ncbi:MAG: heavy-metal-associated domain-containing protein, partial [Bacteroidales bacterium]|nr:heavy-metal-associated domain-containing protein [Bacteroidales bacterium]